MQGFEIRRGWLVAARHRASPNCNERPAGGIVDTLVVHGITLPPGCFGGSHVDALFANQLDPAAHPFFAQVASLRVSAHVFIARTGALTQYVSFTERAWHAGRSHFAGRDNVNDFAIGVELEGTDDCPYSVAQYRRLGWLAATLMRHYPALVRARIVGHSDIAPGRKTDPGPAFDWQRFDRALVAARREAVNTASPGTPTCDGDSS